MEVAGRREEPGYNEWVVDGVRYAVAGHHLTISRGWTRLAKLNLVPRGDSEVRAGRFRKDGNLMWAALSGGVEGRAVLSLADGVVSYSVETSTQHFDKLTYFPDSTIFGDLWHAFIWSSWTRAWDLSEDVSVRIGDCRPDNVDPREGWVIDPGDTPASWPGRGGPRAAAMWHPDYGWWGMCIPGPVPVCDTYLKTRKGRFEILFDYLSPCCDEGFMPSVALAMRLPDPDDPYTVLSVLNTLCRPWRVSAPTHPKLAEFAAMAVCHPWEAFQQASGNSFGSPIPPADKNSPFNTEFLLGLLRDLTALEPSLKWHMLLPQGWFKNIGDFAIGDNLGGEEGFRSVADTFRKGGHLLTVHERFHHFNERSKVGREHPAWVAPLRPGRPKPYWSPNEEVEGVAQIMDITLEEVREYLKGVEQRFLSDEPGCLNMDGITMTGDHWPSSLDYVLANEKYGVGDLLSYKINRDLFAFAKSIKPYAWLGQVFPGGPYGMSAYAATTEDHLPMPVNSIAQLHCISNLQPDVQLHLASYAMTRTKSLTFWPLTVAVSVPEVDNPRAFCDPTLGPNWIPIDDIYRRRLVSSLAAYANCPYTLDTMNLPTKAAQTGSPTDVSAGRIRTDGPLAGFYGAKSIGSQTAVTYSEKCAIVTTTLEGRTVVFPLPPGAKVESAEIVPHEGSPREWDYEIVQTEEGAGIRMHVEDCGKEALYYRVNYSLG